MTKKEIIEILEDSYDVEIETKNDNWFVGTIDAVELEDKIDDGEEPQVLLQTDDGGVIINIADIVSCRSLD